VPGREDDVPRSGKQVAAVLLVLLALAPPAAPARAAGERVALRGTYVQVYGDRRGGGETLHFLRTGGGWLRLRLDGRPSPEPRSPVAVEGVRRGAAVEVTGLRVLGAAPPAPAATGTRDLLVILVTWGSETLRTTQAAAQEFVFGADARSTGSWYQDVSYGQLDWEGAVTPVLTVADPGSCDLYEIAAAASTAAEAAGYNPDGYDHQLVNFPGGYCDSRGFGEVPGTYSWVQDGLAGLDDGYERLLPAHELGHNLGRHHSHGLECGAVTISAACLGSSSSNEEYGNAWDVMGNNCPATSPAASPASAPSTSRSSAGSPGARRRSPPRAPTRSPRSGWRPRHTPRPWRSPPPTTATTSRCAAPTARTASSPATRRPATACR
jgi:hypothetical protein